MAEASRGGPGKDSSEARKVSDSFTTGGVRKVVETLVLVVSSMMSAHTRAGGSAIDWKWSCGVACGLSKLYVMDPFGSSSSNLIPADQV